VCSKRLANPDFEEDARVGQAMISTFTAGCYFVIYETKPKDTPSGRWNLKCDAANLFFMPNPINILASTLSSSHPPQREYSSSHNIVTATSITSIES
jgi:hypothetical protein